MYFVLQDEELYVQGVDELHIFYINNCIVIPKIIDERYQISMYFLKYFKLKSLVNIDDGIYINIRRIKIQQI